MARAGERRAVHESLSGDGVFEGVESVDRKVIVSCPHCFNTLGREYPQLGGTYTVLLRGTTAEGTTLTLTKRLLKN